MTFLGTLFLILLTLKLIGIVHFGWWIVTAPIWGPFVFWFSFILMTMIIEAIGDIFRTRKGS